MVNIKDNFDLYDKYQVSLEFAKTLKPYRTDSKMVFQLYWRVPMDFGRKQALIIKSIITSHYDLNKDNIEINLWSNVDLSDNEYLIQ